MSHAARRSRLGCRASLRTPSWIARGARGGARRARRSCRSRSSRASPSAWTRRAARGCFAAWIPSGSDAILLKHVIHDWNDERATAILRSVRAALPAGGKLLIVEGVYPARIDQSLESRSERMEQAHARREAEARGKVPEDDAAAKGGAGEEHGHAGGGDRDANRFVDVVTAFSLVDDPVQEIQAVVHADADAERLHRQGVHVEADVREVHVRERDQRRRAERDTQERPDRERAVGQDDHQEDRREGGDEGRVVAALDLVVARAEHAHQAGSQREARALAPLTRLAAYEVTALVLDPELGQVVEAAPAHLRVDAGGLVLPLRFDGVVAPVELRGLLQRVRRDQVEAGHGRELLHVGAGDLLHVVVAVLDQALHQLLAGARQGEDALRRVLGRWLAAIRGSHLLLLVDAPVARTGHPELRVARRDQRPEPPADARLQVVARRVGAGRAPSGRPRGDGL